MRAIVVNGGVRHGGPWRRITRGRKGQVNKPKRIRRDPETTRTLILDTTERLMIDEGYAAVTSRRVAQELGINGATVHYYYPITDDLFIALHQRMTERQLAEFEQVLATEDPLAALWTFQSGWAQSALGVEFLALANHRKSIRDVLAKTTDEARDAQTQSLARISSQSAFGPEILPPIALTTILVAIARTLANEERVGITRGHEEVRRFVKWGLANLQRP
ncbi:TetR/AcrR family transcriptional regulator [Novosphingobium sp. G106]|uniref:TetR/AcrR family transcriptional regulator n=1 Tax=Novosphingobium sp. G106 TaxID=2849500 RepID=UPI001C2D3429|nr:TetR/AcrR family transcriptional regulator [Novosphingobium sp. G106]MBV1690432.1 TetR/AcrR family transcriptional regulator [Novosphingobium sp. G106]